MAVAASPSSAAETPPPLPTQRLDLHVPTATILKILVTLLLVSAAARIWHDILLVILSVLIAIALEPAVAWMQRRRLSRGAAIGALTVAMLLAIVTTVGLVIPALVEEIGRFISGYPALRVRLEAGLPADQPLLRRVVEGLLAMPSSPEFTAWMKHPLAWGDAAVSGVVRVGLVVVLSLYFLQHGKRVYAWLLAFVPRSRRDRMATTVQEVTPVVHAYFLTQATSSLLCGLYTAIVLTTLQVPAVLPLALLAAVCDVIPVAGVFIAAVPAAVLAFAVSPVTALGVVALTVVYHLFEVYFLVPRLYGKRLLLSPLAVLLAVIVGGTLMGLPGVVIVLPLVAAYPIIERHWLGAHLAPEVLKDHTAMAGAAGKGRDLVVDAVLRGKQHPGEGRIIR